MKLDIVHYIIIGCFILLIIVFLIVIFIKSKKKKPNVEEVKKIKIESDSPVYQQVNATTNEVINDTQENTDIWAEEAKKLDEKDILIVPEIKEEIQETISPIGIKQVDMTKIEESTKIIPTETIDNGVVKFNGLLPQEKEIEKRVVTKQSSLRPQVFEKDCPNCGAKVSEHATTCFMCGKPV